jgi:DNA-binding transcriptional MerR regulator
MTNVASAGLSIGQVAERTELSVHALRFYEREGLLANPVRRDTAGRRVYTEDDIEWLNICTRLRASGMPLTAIRQYAELVREGSGNEPARLALLREHQDRVAERIRELNACFDLISYKVQVYSERLASGDADQLWNPGSECLP